MHVVAGVALAGVVVHVAGMVVLAREAVRVAGAAEMAGAGEQRVQWAE